MIDLQYGMLNLHSKAASHQFSCRARLDRQLMKQNRTDKREKSEQSQGVPKFVRNYSTQLNFFEDRLRVKITEQ